MVSSPITPNSNAIILRTIFLQIGQSRVLKSCIISTIILSLLYIVFSIIEPEQLVISITYYLLYLSAGLLYFFLSIVLSIAIHEGGHFGVARNKQVDAKLFANRLGDVWMIYPKEIEESLPDQDRYEIGIGPYVRFIDYINSLIFTAGWVVIAFYAPTGLNYFLWVIFLLFLVKIIADVCSFITVRYKLTGGIIVKIAWFVTSRADIEEITNYHIKQM